MDALPTIRVVVINFDGGQMTIDCLESILATDYPPDLLDVVMVDNGSLDDVVERVRAELPAVTVVESLRNTGFAGGCNLGIRAPGRFDHVALVNNDATVARDWLRPLIEALDADDSLGAACPKLLFAERYQQATVEVPDAGTIGNDPRPLGVRVSGVRVDGERIDGGLQFDEGFHLLEAPHAPDDEEMAIWSSDLGNVRFQVDTVDTVDHPNGASATPWRRAELRVSALAPRSLTLRSGDHRVDAGRVLEHRWVGIDLDPTIHDVVNNVGSNLYRNGFAGDRGFLELDEGQYAEPADVFAWCGGAVLLRGSYLDEVGLFDEDLFLYYEDTDLSWRGRLAGWSYRYVPTSVVRHRHAQSSGAWSPTFRYYTERNRILVLMKNAPAPLAARAAVGLVHRLVVRVVRDIVLRPLTLRMPATTEVIHQARVLRGVVRLAPAMLRRRRRWARADRRALMIWETTK